MAFSYLSYIHELQIRVRNARNGVIRKDKIWPGWGPWIENCRVHAEWDIRFVLWYPSITVTLRIGIQMQQLTHVSIWGTIQEQKDASDLLIAQMLVSAIM